MKRSAAPARRDVAFTRRARPLLGTLVEIGAAAGADAAIEAAFGAIATVQACLSRFEADSDLARFHALRAGGSMPMRAATRRALHAAADLERRSDGRFDITLGSAPGGWRCDGDRLIRLSAAARLDLGGIGKGLAVDAAIDALGAGGARAGWVNAGGDLRVFGTLELPIRLRDEVRGGVRAFGSLHDGALATSRFAPDSRSRLAGAARWAPGGAHVSVAAPRCLWADALTKVVALNGETAGPLLAHYGAIAWRH